MNINSSSDVDMAHIESGIGMHHVNTKKVFLEVERNPYLLNADDYTTIPDLLNGYIKQYQRHRKALSTAQKHTHILNRMTTHPVYPINLWNLNPIQIIHYLDYREHVEHAGKHAIRNEYKAIRKYAQLQGIDTTKWGYIPPSPPPSKTRIIPLPRQVKQLLTHKYTRNKLENQNIQYHLTYGFLWGLRPQEYSGQLIDNVKLSDGYVFIIEGKKHHQIRQLFPESELLNNPRRKSLLNLLKLHDHINPDSPFLFIQSNGRPWTTAYLRKWLTGYVKQIYPEYSMYTMRHWCAIARLIASKIETGTWDKEDVKDWLGHDDLRTTDDYTKYAKKYYKLAPYDWIKAILKQPHIWLEENSLDQTTPKTLNTSNSATGGIKYGPTGIQTIFLLLKSLKKLSTSHFKTIFFSFFDTDFFSCKGVAT